MANLATDMNLETAYINGNFKKINLNKDTRKPAASSPITKEESINNAAYMTGKVDTKQKTLKISTESTRAPQYVKKSYRLWVKSIYICEAGPKAYNWLHCTKIL